MDEPKTTTDLELVELRRALRALIVAAKVVLPHMQRQQTPKTDVLLEAAMDAEKKLRE